MVTLMLQDNGSSMPRLSKGVHCAAIDSTSLPPTSAAAYEHSLRVYHQVQAWLEQDLDPTEWGWKIKEGCHVPVTSQLLAAPVEILENIHCGCKTGCKQHQCS